MPRKTTPFYKSEYLLKMYEADTGANGGGAAGAAGDAGTDGGADPGDGGSTPPATPPAANLPMTQAELDAYANKVIASHDKKREAAIQKQIEDAKAAGAAYAKLSDEEKKNADLTAREQALADREAQIRLGELSVAIKADLEEKKLPVDMAAALIEIGNDEKIKAVVSSIKKSFDEAVTAAVNAKLRQDDPKDSAGNGVTGAVNAYAKMRNEAASNKVNAPNPWGI
jgi:hypothetical protein